ncbi:MAG: hypothetical protein ABDH91_03205 [Bacteroidia bacterium]
MLAAVLLRGQGVGIGTALPDPSARLHVEDNQRGLLLPRLGLSSQKVAAPVVNPAIGLLVFNTATAGAGANRGWPASTSGVKVNGGVSLSIPNKSWQIERNLGLEFSLAVPEALHILRYYSRRCGQR